MKASLAKYGLLALTLLSAQAEADNILQNASFEAPKVEGSIDERKGGSPVRSETETSWTHYLSTDAGGKLTVGLTNGFARTGSQAIYVQFDKAQAVKAAFLMSDLIPIKATENYRVSLWGRIDRKRPLTLDQGRPLLRLQVEFYQADQGTQVRDTEYRSQMIPGSLNRVLFTADRWTEYFAEFKAPLEAEFMKITFQWDAPDKEPADGVVYFDDAALDGVRGNLVSSLDPEAAKAEIPPPEAEAPVPPAK